MFHDWLARHCSLLTLSIPSRRFQAFYGSHRPPLCPDRSSMQPHDLGSTFRVTGSTDTGPRPSCSCPRAWANRRNTVGESQRAEIGRREKVKARALFSTSRSPIPTLDTPRGGAILSRSATQTEAGLPSPCTAAGCQVRPLICTSEPRSAALQASRRHQCAMSGSQARRCARFRGDCAHQRKSCAHPSSGDMVSQVEIDRSHGINGVHGMRG